MSGWNMDLSNVNLPTKIRCHVCHQWKNNASYSNRQLNEVRFCIKRDGSPNLAQPRCKDCTGGPKKHELKCRLCKTYKSLDEFSKAQRKRPEDAKCMKCVTEHVNMKPPGADSDSDSSIEEEEEDGASDDGDDDTTTLNTKTESTKSDLARPGSPSVSTEGGVALPSLAGLSIANSSTTSTTVLKEQQVSTSEEVVYKGKGKAKAGESNIPAGKKVFGPAHDDDVWASDNEVSDEE